MKIIPWDLPLVAPWPRSLDLKRLTLDGSGLVLLLEEEQGSAWNLKFKAVQAFRVTAEERAGPLIELLPAHGALFEVNDSPWIMSLGVSASVANARHYIVCCYDEVVEIVALETEVRSLEKLPN